MKRWMVLALAVGFVLTASFSAQADSVLMPWVIKDRAISTIISVVNRFDPTPEGKNVRFHFMYWYKKSTENKSTESCEEIDFCVPTSYNDILVFDAAGNFNGGAPLFGDTAVKGQPYMTVQGASLALPVDGPRRAYLVITNEVYTSEVCGGADPADKEDSIYAEAMVVDIANGAAWGYDGYNPRNLVFEPDVLNPDRDRLVWWNFMDNETAKGITDALGQVVAGEIPSEIERDSNKWKREFAFLTIMPPNAGIITKMFVTPVGIDMVHPPANYYANVKLYCLLPKVNDTYPNGLGGMFDYDENCLSFDTYKPVVCTDGSPIEQYTSGAAWLIFRNTKAEGWAHLYLPDPVNPPAGTQTTKQAVIGKLEYSLGTAAFDGNRISAPINNFLWVRGRPFFPIENPTVR